MRRSIVALVGIVFTLAAPANAQDAVFDMGGDHYAAGQNTTITTPVSRDAFAAGFNVRLDAPVTGDAHAAGFDVDVGERVDGDLYAGGFTVEVDAPVAGDITALGSSVVLTTGADIGGNVRLSGASVTVSAPIDGSALVSADTLNFNSTVAGDLNFYGRTIQFGPDARVSGRLAIRAPEEIAVPTSVAAADRVSYQQLEAPDYVGEAGRTAGSMVRTIWPAFWAAVVWVTLLLLIGVLFIALAPRLVSALETESSQRPMRKFGLGIVTFASVLGLVPLAAMTIFGLLVLPFILIFAVIACGLAYLAGVYLLGLRIGGAFLAVNTNLKRLGVLVLAVLVGTAVGIIPFLGWLFSLVLTAMGFGAIAAVMLGRPDTERQPGGADASAPAPGE